MAFSAIDPSVKVHPDAVTVSVSFDALSAMVTTTCPFPLSDWLVPSFAHVEQKAEGSIASLYVTTTVSSAVALPSVPPFVSSTLVAVGAVVSTVKVLALLVPVLPAVSVWVDCAV